MAQFIPGKKTIKDFNDGEEYLNRIDVVQAETVNNLVEGLLYAQENGGSGGGSVVSVNGRTGTVTLTAEDVGAGETTMLTEGREGGRVLRKDDYFLELVDDSTVTMLRTVGETVVVSGDRNTLIIDECGVEKGQELVINSQQISKKDMLLIGG